MFLFSLATSQCEWKQANYNETSYHCPPFPLDTERKSHVHKTFRRSLGRLLNVFCTFNLRPVSTGFEVFSIVMLLIPFL